MKSHISQIINCMYFQILLSRNVKPSLQQLLLCDNSSSFTIPLRQLSFTTKLLNKYPLRQLFFAIICTATIFFCNEYPLRQFFFATLCSAITFFCNKYALRQLSQQIFFAKILFYKNNSLQKNIGLLRKFVRFSNNVIS